MTKIPFEDLGAVTKHLRGELVGAFERVLDSGIFILGPEVESFERLFAEKFSLGQAVGVASGYDALTIAFLALGLREGEVIIPANTYMATVLAAMRAGLSPVLVDPDPETLLLCPEGARRAITGKTVAILPVHLYGLACDMGQISLLAKEHGLKMVEDCAQAHGARFGGRFVGAFSDAAAFSFYPTKNLGALGDGGVVAVGEPATASRARMLRNYGADERGEAVEIGLNSRLDELQAAILKVRLARLDETLRRKNEIAAAYDAGLDKRIKRPLPVKGSTPAKSLYPVLLQRRDELKEHLAGLGIGAKIHYPTPPHRHGAIAHAVSGDFPVSDRISSTILSLPLSERLTDGEVKTIIDAVNDFCGK